MIKLFNQLFSDKRTRLLLGAAFATTLFCMWLCMSYRSTGHRWWAFLFAGAAYVPLWLVYKYLVKSPGNR